MRKATTFAVSMMWVLLLVGITVLTGCRRTISEAAEAPPGAVEELAEVAEPPRETPGSQVPEALGPSREETAATPAPRPAEPPSPPATAELPGTVPEVQDPPESRAPAPPPPPVLVTVPTGTLIAVELEQALSSHTSQVGENFRARLTQGVAGEGKIALPAGTRVSGRVIEASPAKKIGGRARLSLEFHTLHLASGQTVPLHAVFAQAGKSQTGKDAAIIGGSTVGGAILGGAIDKGEGTAIGAVVGGLAGAAVAKQTKGKPVELPAGTVLTLETTQPVTVEVSV